MNHKIVVVTGAGISVDSGIQPFRGKNGLWNENPTAMASYEKFCNDPAPSFRFPGIEIIESSAMDFCRQYCR